MWLVSLDRRSIEMCYGEIDTCVHVHVCICASVPVHMHVRVRAHDTSRSDPCTQSLACLSLCMSYVSCVMSHDVILSHSMCLPYACTCVIRCGVMGCTCQCHSDGESEEHDGGVRRDTRQRHDCTMHMRHGMTAHTARMPTTGNATRECCVQRAYSTQHG